MLTPLLLEQKEQKRVQRQKDFVELSRVVNGTVASLTAKTTLEVSKFKEFAEGAAKIGKPKSIFALYETALAQVGRPGGPEFKDGLASVVVNVDGRIANVIIEKVDGKDDAFNVAIAELALNEKGLPVVSGTLTEPVLVTREVVSRKKKDGEGLENVDFYTARLNGVEVKQDQYFSMDHQANALEATVNAPITQENNQQVQFITAGTASGKTGILTGAAYACEGGVFVVPAAMVKETSGEGANFGTGKLQIFEPKTNQPGELKAFLADPKNKYAVISHDQFIKYHEELSGSNVFIDEVHMLSSDNNKQEEENSKIFKDFIDKRKRAPQEGRALAVTATPNLNAFKILGKVVFDFSLFDAIKIGKIRPVTAIPPEGAPLPSVSDKLLVNTACEHSLTAQAKDTKGNLVAMSSHPGIVFVDDVDTANSIGERFNDPAGLNLEAQAALGELQKRQMQSIEANIMIDIITAVYSANPEKPEEVKKAIVKLQGAIRKGDLTTIQAEYAKVASTLDKQIIEDKLKERKKTSSVTGYYDAAVAYMNADTDEKKQVLSGIEHSVSTVVVPGATVDDTTRASDKAKELLDKGLAIRAVCVPPCLVAGYSNKSVLSVIAVQTKPIKPGAAEDAVQEFGRCLRDDDLAAYVESIYLDSLPEEKRGMSAGAVMGKGLAEAYNKQLEAEEKIKRIQKMAVVHENAQDKPKNSGFLDKIEGLEVALGSFKQAMDYMKNDVSGIRADDILTEIRRLNQRLTDGSCKTSHDAANIMATMRVKIVELKQGLELFSAGDMTTNKESIDFVKSVKYVNNEAQKLITAAEKSEAAYKRFTHRESSAPEIIESEVVEEQKAGFGLK